MNSVLEKVRDHYNRYPYPSYPLFVFGRWKNIQSVNVTNWGLKSPAKNILIAGCGTISAQMFARVNFRSKITAIDLSASSLWRARLRSWLWGLHNIEFRCMDFQDLRDEEKFDAIDAYGVLHHLESPLAGLMSLARNLKPGGIIRVMLYGGEERQEFDELRREFRAKAIVDLESARKELESRKITLTGDLKTRSGMADALLHPQVTTYDLESVKELFSQVQSLEIEKIEELGNFIVFAKSKEIARDT